MKALLIFALSVPLTAQACLWVNGTTIDGSTRQVSGLPVANELRRAMAREPNNETAARNFGKPESEAQKKEAAAVDLVFAGDLEGAIRLLKQMDVESPDSYSTNANLGTAYELIGDNESALRCIKAAVRLNPVSHYGTEWLHVLILETKLQSAKNPDYLVKNRILNVPERMQSDTQIEGHGFTQTAREVSEALLHQLRERLVFVKPKDAYVADLLYSYALVKANLGSVESGIGLLKLAKEYGFSDEGLLDRHLREYESIRLTAQIKQWAVIGGCVGAAILLLYYCYRRKWFFLSNRAYMEYKASLIRAESEAS